MKISGHNWPRDSYGYINMSVAHENGTSGRAQDERYCPQECGLSCRQEAAASGQNWPAGYNGHSQWTYVEQHHTLPPQKRFLHPGWAFFL